MPKYTLLSREKSLNDAKPEWELRSSTSRNVDHMPHDSLTEPPRRLKTLHTRMTAIARGDAITETWWHVQVEPGSLCCLVTGWRAGVGRAGEPLLPLVIANESATVAAVLFDMLADGYVAETDSEIGTGCASPHAHDDLMPLSPELVDNVLACRDCNGRLFAILLYFTYTDSGREALTACYDVASRQLKNYPDYFDGIAVDAVCHSCGMTVRVCSEDT